MRSSRLSALLAVVLVVGLLLAACGPAPTPQTVEKVVTQVVEKQVTQVVEKQVVQTQVVTQEKQVVVTPTPAPTADTSKNPVTLRFMTWTSNETQLKLLNDIAAAYKTTHPNVTVKYESIPLDEFPGKVTIQLAGGDPPDLGWINDVNIANWIKAGVLDDLAPKLKSTPNYDLADFSQSAIAGWTRGEAVYGIPFSTSPFFVMYNADLFKAAGLPTPDEYLAKNQWTFETFAQAAKTIQEKSPKGTYGFLGVEGNNIYGPQIWTGITQFIWSYGGDLWTSDYQTCKINSPESVKGLSVFQKMVTADKSVVPPGETAAFASGNIGMSFGQLSRLGALKDVKFKWGIAPLPSGPAGYKPTIGQAGIVTFRQGKNKAAAQDFVAFITNKENITKLAQFWPPARKSILNTDAISKNYPNVDPASLKAAVNEGVLNGNLVPSHPDFAKVELAMRPIFDKLWTKDANVQALMNDACKAAAAYFPGK